MLERWVQIKVDPKTFPMGVPSEIVGLAGTSLDMRQALLMLGSLTLPNGFSNASPARFWAWVRYLSAISNDSTLKIAGPFSDLDPHQKSVLSDDFGVAVSTHWLQSRVGGMRAVVDGRGFVLQYARLLGRRVDTKRYAFFFACETIFQAPVARTTRLYFDI